MNKFFKIIILCLVLCMAIGVFVACENTKYGPIGTTEDKDKEVINNGSLVVQQGKYLYYVNGMDATSNITKPEDNYFGKASVKGSIMKSEIAEDGSLKNTAVVVPKMMYTAATNGGIYIYGEWIYYMTPSTKTDNQSNVLVDQLVAMRTKIDGTKTEQIAELSANNNQYVFTESAFIYYEGTSLKKVGYSNSSVDKKASEIAKDITGILFTNNSTTIFFTKATESKVRQNNNIYVVANGQVKEVTTDATYEGSENDLSKQYVFSLLQYDAKENVLYYSKSNSSSDASKITGTYGYKFGEDFSFDASKEKMYAVSALSTFVSLGFDKGLMDMSAVELKLYKPINAGSFVNDTEVYATLSATGAKVIKIDDTYMYYVLSNKLYRIKYADKKAVVEQISNDEDLINTSWLSASIIGDYLYYIDNTYSYLFRMDLSSYVAEPNNIEFAKSEIVSGTRKAKLTKNDKDEIVIEYVADDANEEGVTYYQIPKFMTEKDIDTYAAAIYKDPESDK